MADDFKEAEFVTFVRSGGIPVTVVRYGGTYVRVIPGGGKLVTFVSQGGTHIVVDNEKALPDEVKEWLGIY
jgi:hypothetical protein